MSIVTLTTDFGTVDNYVGVVKGVILSAAPQTRLVDLTHEIPAQDVGRAAFALCTAVSFFPTDTVHLVVVDPGVGSSRRGIAVRTPRGILVGPDNGVFTYVLAEAAEWSAVELRNDAHRLERVSRTFHGRDVFAPAAAHLARGGALDDLGPPLLDPIEIPLPKLEVSGDRVEGEILYDDRFGNLITSVGRLYWDGDRVELYPAFRRGAPEIGFAAAEATIELGGWSFSGIRPTYATVRPGQPVAVVGGAGFLEIAVCQGSGADLVGVHAGARVVVYLESE